MKKKQECVRRRNFTIAHYGEGGSSSDLAAHLDWLLSLAYDIEDDVEDDDIITITEYW